MLPMQRLMGKRTRCQTAPVARVRSAHIFVLSDLVSCQESHFFLCIMVTLDVCQTTASAWPLSLFYCVLSLSLSCRSFSIRVLAGCSLRPHSLRLSAARCQSSCSCHGNQEAELWIRAANESRETPAVAHLLENNGTITAVEKKSRNHFHLKST